VIWNPPMPECPTCQKPIPSGNGGLVRTRRRGRRITYTVGRWCLYCEVWGMVDVSVLAPEFLTRGEDPKRREVGPQKACKREAAMAVKAIFGKKHLAVPID
jgi:hypothetical protein